MTSMVITGEIPEIEEAMRRRHESGADAFDEMWDGVLHVTPHAHFRHSLLEVRVARVLEPLADAKGLIVSGAFNLGNAENYRIPDLGMHESDVPVDLYLPTAVVVIEILSPDDETLAKLGFYAAHKIEEVLVVDPDLTTVVCWQFRADGFPYSTGASRVLDIDMHALSASIKWP